MITIKTRLHDGIYQSQGGGQVKIKEEYNKGPLNLIKASNRLYELRQENTRSYGSIGGGHSWLEIDGKEISDYDLDDTGECRLSLSGSRDILEQFKL